jgi:hypothetical protein
MAAHKVIVDSAFANNLPLEYRKNFNTFIRDVWVGASGSGVFHAEKTLARYHYNPCVADGLSNRASRMARDLGGLDTKHFISAATIAELLPPEFRF